MKLDVIRRLIWEDDGVAASEYAIAVALIIVAVVAAVSQFMDFDQVYIQLNSVLRALLN